MGILLVTLLTLAQPNAQGDDDTIYEIRIRGIEQPIYGWMEEVPNGWRITRDAPWLGNPHRTYTGSEVDVADRVIEVGSKRAERREREARRDGYKEVAGQWVKLTEAELADRANAMITEVRRASTLKTSTPVADAAPHVDAPVSTPARPGFLAQWGLHVAIVVVAGVLIALVVRFAILV